MQPHDIKMGLSAAEAAERLARFGPNDLQAKKPATRLEIFMRQFRDAMIIILVVAAGISFAMGEQIDAYVILAIILGNAILGYTQEYNAAQSVQKLRQMSPPQATVIRDGAVRTISSSELVPGDIISLEAGNLIPADARLLELHAFKTDEAALTGESVSVEKKLEPAPADAPLAERTDTVFKGTHVSNGTAIAEVTTTGMSTELGKIAALLGGEQGPTPLQKRLTTFSKQLALVVLAICALIFGLGLMRGEPALKMFLTAVSLAVAALPEALPAVVTIALAKGATALARKNALVRRLPVVETLGSVTYICSDKTGTLTQNKMTVEHTEATTGNEELLMAAMLLNSDVKQGSNGTLHGDSTEIALIEHARAKGYSIVEASRLYPVVGRLPFDSERMLMATVHQAGGKWLVLVKGAPVKVMEAVSASDMQKEQWLQKNRSWAGEGLRVLFFAARFLDKQPEDLKPETLERDMAFIGMTGMIDPPREEVTDAIRDCQRAGITPVMITGDQPLTAATIARRLNILPENGPVAVSGAELQKMDAAAFAATVKKTRVYARVSPEQKLSIVKALQDNGEFVAMTGDGVNDAPSLKQADIGIAMGITGTDVSKEAAGMILLDDNFTTIVRAVKEGRRIYANIRKFIQYVLSSNMGEVMVLFFAPLLGLPLPLLPIHILWLNLVTDGFPGLALVSEPGDRDLMRTPPRPPKESQFAGGMLRNIVFTGIVVASATLGVQAWASGQGYSVAGQQSLVFTVLCVVQLGNALAVRAGRYPLFSGIFSNPFLLVTIAVTLVLQGILLYAPFANHIFKTTPLDRHALTAVTVCAAGSLIIIECAKLIARRWDHTNRKKTSST